MKKFDKFNLESLTLLERKATPAPWTIAPQSNNCCARWWRKLKLLIFPPHSSKDEADMRLVVATRNALPYLLDGLSMIEAGIRLARSFDSKVCECGRCRQLDNLLLEYFS